MLDATGLSAHGVRRAVDEETHDSASAREEPQLRKLPAQGSVVKRVACSDKAVDGVANECAVRVRGIAAKLEALKHIVRVRLAYHCRGNDSRLVCGLDERVERLATVATALQGASEHVTLAASYLRHLRVGLRLGCETLRVVPVLTVCCVEDFAIPKGLCDGEAIAR